MFMWSNSEGLKEPETLASLIKLKYVTREDD